MTRGSTSARRITWAAAGFLSAVSFAGCNDNDLGIERRRPNRPPETRLSSGPPDSTNSTNYRVHLFWSGSDPDGTIDHYDYILVDHRPSASSITGPPDDPRTVIVVPPLPDDPRWTSTNANDTLIVTVADVLRRDPRPDPNNPNDTNEVVRSTTFERWHTFFVRAVDNEGVEDVTPEYRSFNSRTIAPTVRLTDPIKPAQTFLGPKTIVFNWDGDDPVGDGTNIAPVASRWVLLPVRKVQNTFIGFPDSLYYLPRYARWSSWKNWDASDGSGRQAIVPNLQHTGTPGLGFYLFAVQAMDEAGAVTPVFDSDTGGKNNVAKVQVSDFVGATLTVTERVLGTYNFVGGSRPVVLDMAAGQEIVFRWHGDAKGYGGTIRGYRYGWNIRNPQNDQEWDQSWGLNVLRSTPRKFNSGSQRFFIECRDNAETVTRAEFELVVRQVTRTKDLLLVDDTEQPDDRNEPIEDARWLAVMDSLRLRRRSIDFQPSRDIYDVVENRYFPPPIARVFDYKTVVWSVVQGRSGSALKTLGLFFDPFLPQNLSQVIPFNYLNIYLDNGGEMWLNGDLPAHVIWPVLRQQDVDLQFPVNVTNWDDPVVSHNNEDSVGVNSLLFKLGVEMFDLGGGNRAPQPRRDQRNHNCIEFFRTPPDSLQGFTSDEQADHTHSIVIRLRDVENPPAAGRTITTSRTDHQHTVTLSRADLQRLARGDRFTVPTSSSDEPSVHAHSFLLFDRQGLWSAPERLMTDLNWPLPLDPGLNPLRSRPNVEIYNNPIMMANPRIRPPLEPPAGTWLPLYLYRSGVPSSSETGVGWPLTADGSPSVILRRALVTDPYYSRALCGFEVWRLRFDSHLALADYILLRHMRLGLAGP